MTRYNSIKVIKESGQNFLESRKGIFLLADVPQYSERKRKQHSVLCFLKKQEKSNYNNLFYHCCGDTLM